MDMDSLKENDKIKLVKYRTEQTVFIRLNGIPTNNTKLKIDYAIMYDKINNPLHYSVRVDDYIAQSSPDSYQEFLDLVAKIEALKSNVDVLINPLTGRIECITNHHSIVLAWNNLKDDLLTQYEFIRAKEGRNNFSEFMTVFDTQISSVPELKEGLDKKLMFNTFFDSFLVSDANFETPTFKNFYSQLFTDVAIELDVAQKIVKESPETVIVRKTGKPIAIINTKEIETQYNEKYKPVLDYKFSDYEVEYDAEVAFNTLQQNIEYADIKMKEFVKNNIELEIICQIRRKE